MKDNWKHRSEGMLCKTCMFYAPKGEGLVGRCRKNAPTLDGWPVIFPNDWCGNHKLNEETLPKPNYLLATPNGWEIPGGSISIGIEGA